jgi:hypothetical protein
MTQGLSVRDTLGKIAKEKWHGGVSFLISSAVKLRRTHSCKACDTIRGSFFVPEGNSIREVLP